MYSLFLVRSRLLSVQFYGKELLVRLTECSVCTVSIYYFGVCFFFHFGFEGGNVVLIVSFPDHCLPFTFQIYIHYCNWFIKLDPKYINNIFSQNKSFNYI